ncbi:MAG: hypothetical protein AAGE84_06420 [Cyanobacteria bacterium P01_G01_bin.39]
MSDLKFKLHNRQFVIGSQPFYADDDWCCRQLDSSSWISYSPNLRVNWATDKNGCVWYLLGLAVDTLTNTDLIAQIRLLSSEQVVQSYFNWTGRWILVGQGQIHLDANGLLGCFYGSNSQGETWISSSCALLIEILQSSNYDARYLEYGKGISWYTPPLSRFKDIKRLLASQILDFKHDRLIHRPLMPQIEVDRHYDETIKLVKESLVTALHNIGQQPQQLWLGLTAGYDSRLILAIAKSAKIEFTTFTRIAGRMSLADRLLPSKLAREFSVPHVWLRNKPPKQQQHRRELVKQHSVGSVSDGDAEPFIMGVRDSLEGISFGGHGFAIASGFHDLRQLPATFDSPQTGAAQIAALFNEPEDSLATEGLRHWLTWVEADPQSHLDWRDRFFLEQRQAGWLSAKEQVYDLNSLERFPILNSARIYSLLLSIPESKRLGSLVQVELLSQLAPELLQYPFNPPDNYFSHWLKVAIRTRDRPQYIYTVMKDKLLAPLRLSRK